MSRLTPLAPLELIGRGTSHVESLESYVCRLAEIHGLSTRQMCAIARAHAVLSRREARNETSDFRRPVERIPALNAVEMIGYGENAQRTVNSLQALTGVANLDSGTLLSFRGVFALNVSGCFRRDRRWCPICFDSSSGAPSEPLCWRLHLVQRCPVHMCLLENQCRRCGQPQDGLRSAAVRRLCGQCGETLSGTGRFDWGMNSWELWAESQAMDLIAYVSNPMNPKFRQGAAKEFFREVYKQHDPGLTRDQRRILFQLQSEKSSAAPRLNTFFMVSALRAVSPLQALLAPREAAAAPLGFLEHTALVMSMPRTMLRPGSMERLFDRLRYLLATPADFLLPPLKLVCHEMGVGVGFLYTKNLELYREYGAVSKVRRAEIALATKARAVQAARNIYSDIESFSSWTGPNVRETTRLVMAASGASKHVSRLAIEQVTREQQASRRQL